VFMANSGQRNLLMTPSTNAHVLLAGRPVESVRRRLKVASVIYDNVVLEAGLYRAQAGSGGSTNFRHGFGPGETPLWQTAHQRSIAKGKTFGISVGLESVPGVPATSMHPVMASESEISWAATLEPFAAEFPEGCDWISWVVRPHSLPNEVSKLARLWTDRDERNAVLERRFPTNHVRSRIIRDTNEDLAICAGEGWVLSADPLHNEVLSGRLRDEEGWHLEGFALPIIVPAIGDLSWEAVSDIRRDKGIRYLRDILRDVEVAAMEAAMSAGDLESAVHQLVDDELIKANEATGALRSTIKRSVLGILIATGVGFATVGITGPLGIMTAAGGSTAIGSVIDVRDAMRSKRSRAWLGALAKVKATADA